ncbi:hypothetical protein Tco_1054380 [Tanacetum coccineum]|uniref:Uncharacterized protein n=1 Tax=Tanacetum coccineum TaxID=301880 RepID=A0ABQ5GWL4_9ASTR
MPFFKGNNYIESKPWMAISTKPSKQSGAVYQALPYQPLTNQPLVNQALPPISQIQGVSKTDFDNYVKANDALMAITTRSGKTCEGPSNPLVPTPVVSIPSKEPEQNPETSTDKVQKPSSESTAQVPTSE